MTGYCREDELAEGMEKVQLDDENGEEGEGEKVSLFSS